MPSLTPSASINYFRHTALAFLLFSVAPLYAAGTKAVINSDQVLVIDGKKVFAIGFTTPPLPEAKTPTGKNGIQELAEAGATFMRTGAKWDADGLRREQAWLDAAARNGMYCLPYLREHSVVKTDAAAAKLRELIDRFKDHPGLGAWKGDDEPEWGKVPLPPLTRAYQIIKETDPDHPVVIIHAPRGTVDSLRAYNPIADIIGADIYPISFPPGIHSTLTNKTMGLVGDHTRIMMDTAQGKLPVWMVLQISWSGVLKPGKTLRFPTFAEERFMTYEAIICGARGLIYFGGNNEGGLNDRDKALGWNWDFWNRILRPVIEEIGSHSPLYPALVARNSTLPLKVTLNRNIEFCSRQIGSDLFILACKRDGPDTEVEFTGLPSSAAVGEVLYESPRRVEAKSEKFKDWFAPFTVHAYRFRL